MQDNKEQKQTLLREKILNAQYDPVEFQNFMINLEKGAILQNYTLEELNDVIEQFMEVKKQEKQQYLRENIIEKNYDVQSFVQYMSEQKIDGAFIDNWTMEELIEVVNAYKQKEGVFQSSYQETYEEKDQRINEMSNFLAKSTMKQPDGDVNFELVGEEESVCQKMRQNMWDIMKNPNKINKNRLENIQEVSEIDNNSEVKAEEQKQESVNNPYLESQLTQDQLEQSKLKHQEEQEQWKKVKLEKEKKDFFKKYSYQLGKLIVEPYEDSIEVNKEKNRLPQNNKLRVTIPRWEKQKTGLFGLGGGVAVYEICTEPFKWNVYRKLIDFFQLRKILVKIFPGKWIPPLDNNTNESSESDILQRKRFLIQFIMHLKESEEIWSNAITQIFLSEQNKWDTLTQQLKEQKDPKICVTSTTGLIKLRLSKQNQIYIEEAEKFINEAKQEFSHLQTQTLKLQEQFSNISNQCLKIQQSHQNLMMQVNNFQIQLSQKLPKSDELQQIQLDNNLLQQSFKSLSQMVSALSKSTKQQAGLVDQMNILFRYSYLDMNNNADNFKNYYDSEKTYIKFVENTFKQMQNDPSFKQNPRVIGEELQVKQDYSYWQNQVYSEVQKQLYSQSKDYSTFLNYMCKYEALRMNELIKTWNKVTEPYFQSPLPIPKVADTNNMNNNSMFQSVLKSQF